MFLNLEIHTLLNGGKNINLDNVQNCLFLLIKKITLSTETKPSNRFFLIKKLTKIIIRVAH